METTHKAFEEILPQWKDINFGIILISVYYLLDFGSIQGLFPIVAFLKIPLIVSALSVGYAIILFFNREFYRDSGVTCCLFYLLLFVAIYSLLSTGNPVARNELIKVCLIYYANYIIIVSKVKKKTQFIFIVDVLLLAIAFSSYNGSFQGGLVWGSRWLNDENQLSLLVDMAFPFATVLLVLHKSKLKKAFYLFCLFNYTIVNVIAHSRGGTIGLVLVILLCILVMKNKIRNLFFMIFVMVISLHYAPPIFFDDMATLERGTKEETADDRLYLWGIAIDMFVAHPLFGVGPMNYPFCFEKYEKHVRYTSTFRVSHSTPIENLAETGLVGVFFFLLLQVQLYKNWRCITLLGMEGLTSDKLDKLYSLKLVTHACAISQIAFHWCSLFLTLFLFPFYWGFLPLSEAWKNICIADNRHTLQDQKNIKLNKLR